MGDRQLDKRILVSLVRGMLDPLRGVHGQVLGVQQVEVEVLVDERRAQLPKAGDPGTVSFTPANFTISTIGELNVSLSPADFANDFNGTVLATFLLPVPEPSSFTLLGFSIAGAIAAWLGVSRRVSVRLTGSRTDSEMEEVVA